jgi:para-nitrobenzyl esterase
VAARYEDKLAPADEATAKAALGYWVAFAKTGNPNGAGRPNWPAYNANDDQLMNFTNGGPVAEHDAWKSRLDLTEASLKSN